MSTALALLCGAWIGATLYAIICLPVFLRWERRHAADKRRLNDEVAGLRAELAVQRSLLSGRPTREAKP